MADMNGNEKFYDGVIKKWENGEYAKIIENLDDNLIMGLFTIQKSRTFLLPNKETINQLKTLEKADQKWAIKRFTIINKYSSIYELVHSESVRVIGGDISFEDFDGKARIIGTDIMVSEIDPKTYKIDSPFEFLFTIFEVSGIIKEEHFKLQSGKGRRQMRPLDNSENDQTTTKKTALNMCISQAAKYNITAYAALCRRVLFGLAEFGYEIPVELLYPMPTCLFVFNVSPRTSPNNQGIVDYIKAGLETVQNPHELFVRILKNMPKLPENPMITEIKRHKKNPPDNTRDCISAYEQVWGKEMGIKKMIMDYLSFGHYIDMMSGDAYLDPLRILQLTSSMLLNLVSYTTQGVIEKLSLNKMFYTSEYFMFYLSPELETVKETIEMYKKAESHKHAYRVSEGHIQAVRSMINLVPQMAPENYQSTMHYKKKTYMLKTNISTISAKSLLIEQF